MADKIDALFSDLQSRGFAKDKTIDEFRSYMLAPGKQGYQNRKDFFDDFKGQGMADLNSYEEFANLLGLRAAKPKSAQPAKAPAIPTQLDLEQAHQMGAGRGPISWEEKPTKKPEDESALEKARRIFGGGATPEENQRTQKRLQQRTDEIAYEQETGNRMRQPVLNPDFEAPVIARDDYGNVRYDENGNIMQGFSTDPDVVQSHQQVVGEQQEWDALSDEEKRERAKQIQNEIDYLDYQEPTMFESFYKGLGSGMLNAGIGLLNVMDQLASGQIVEDASSPTGFTRTKGYDPNDTGTGVGRGLKAANEAAESLSRQAQPNRGQGFLDMLWDGNLTGVLQKGVATAAESLPMTLSAYSPSTMVLNGISMAGNNFREQTLENPDVPLWKRASMAIGSAAIEQIVEKYSDPVFKYIGGTKIVGKAAKEASQEIASDVTKKATESIAKRIFNRLAGLGKDAAGEGAEEIISNFGNDTLGEALDLLDGEKNYGIRAQWADLKKRNPNADMWEFALQKGKEYTESFIGGALAGFYTSGTTQVSAKALEYSLGKMVSQEEIEQNPGTPIDPVTMEVAQAYDDGYTAEDANQRKNFNDEAVAAAEVLPKYGDEFAKMVTESENPVETMGYLMENRDYFTDEQIEVAADYFQKKAAADGMMDGVLDQIDQEVEYANAEVVSNTHQQTGNVIAAQIEDGTYYIIGGNVINDPETGMPIVAGNGGAVVVKDAQTGEVSVKNPQDVRIVDMQSADDMLAYNNNVLRQQLMQQADEDITYGAPANEAYQIEDVVTLRDEQGNTIEGTIVQEPNAVDGVYVVQTADNKALQLTADELNRRIMAHNGAKVQRAASPQQVVEPEQPVENGSNSQLNGENITENAENNQIYAQNQAENIQNSGNLDNAAGENAPAEDGGQESNQQRSALSRIPVRKDAYGNPFTNKKGKPVLDWHKASVEDAAAALIETTGGNMIMARDTASDLIKQGQQKLEKIRKQQPKGEDPIEIAESRMEIQKQVEEQQAINAQWQNVNQHIQKLMREEQQRIEAEREAAKSEEQRAREAEEKRQLEEKRRKIDEERRAKKREEELAAWNKPYAPLARARKELAGDPEALAILDDVEPRSLEEWVSASLRPHSIMWDNEEIDGREVTGLQAELGLQKKDIDRIGTLVAPSKKGGKPFGAIVHEIWEDLPDGLRNMYDDQDVRNALIGLFGEGDALRMRHMAEENRIQEAREMARENQERAAEAELEAWAEAYNLNPEERAAFEEYMQVAPSAEEQEIINNSIYDESYRTGETENRESDKRRNVSGTQRGESQVQQESEAADNGNSEEQQAQGREAEEGKPSVANDNVPGESEESGVIPTPKVDQPRFDAIRQRLADAYAEAYKNENPETLKAVRDAAIEVQRYVNEGLNDNTPYRDGIEDYDGTDPYDLADQYITRVYHDSYVDRDPDSLYISSGLKPEKRKEYAGAKAGNKLFEFNEHGVAINPNIIENYDKKHCGYKIETALTEAGWVGGYWADGPTWGSVSGASNGYYTEFFPTEEECIAYEAQRALNYIKGHKDPKMKRFEVALQDIINKNTKKSPAKEQPVSKQVENNNEGSTATAPNGKLFSFDENGVCLSPDVIQPSGDKLFVNILTAYNGQGWVGFMEIRSRFDYNRGDVTKNATPVFQTEEECRAHFAGKAIEELKESYEGKQEVLLIKALRKMQNQRSAEPEQKEEPVAEAPKPKKPAEKKKRTPKDSDFTGLQQGLRLKTPDGTIVIWSVDYDKLQVHDLDENGNQSRRTRSVDTVDIADGLKNGTIEKIPEDKELVAPGTVMKNNIAGGNAVAKIVGSRINGVNGQRMYLVEYYPDEQAVKERIAIGDAYVSQKDLQQTLDNGGFTAIQQSKTEQPQDDENTRALELFNSLNENDVLVNDSGMTATINKKVDSPKNNAVRINWTQATENGPSGHANKIFNVINLLRWVEANNLRKQEKVEQPKAKKPAEPQHNRLVSDEKMEELRKRLIEKMNNLNSGIDPELMIIGGTFAVGKIERGFTKFADYATEMVRELGDAIRPYLKAFYETVRQMPGSENYRADMDSQDYVNNFDVLNFDKDGKVADPIAKAEHVVKENNIKKKAKKIKADQPDLFAGDLFADQLEPAAEPIGKTSTKAEIKAEEAKVDTNPTEAQKEAGNYQKGHIWVDGYDVTIENPKGSIRRGTDANGNEWQVTMNNTYGYIKGTEGVDGDHIDVFLSDKPTTGSVYVIDQVNPDGTFDEHKVMYGFQSEQEAREAYLSNYSKGWKVGTITEVSREDFKKWVNSSHRKTKPFADYKIADNPWILATRGEDGTLMRRAIDSDLDNGDVQYYYNGKPVHIMLVTRAGEQVSATQFSKPKVESVTLTDGKRVKFGDLWVKVNPIVELNRDYKNNNTEYGRVVFDNIRTNVNTGEVEYVGRVREFGSSTSIEFAIKEKDLQNNLDNGTYKEIPVFDKNDYRTYMTPEAKEYFAQDPRFAGWTHKNLAFVTAAIWDQVEIPGEELRKLPEIIEAENRIKATMEGGKLTISEEERDKLANRLIESRPAKQERKAIIVVGLPAGGKSSVFANPLSKQFGARIIDSDDVKPWLSGYDNGNGAGYVQDASSEVAERAVDLSVKNGDNILLPRIGGESVYDLALVLRLMDYDVQLYFNDVKGVTSIDRATSRFAETGRYLSLDYLTKKAGVPSEKFCKFAEKSIGDYYNERTENKVQNIRGRLVGLLGSENLAGERLRKLSADVRGREAEADENLQNLVGAAGVQDAGNELVVKATDPLFTYAEWKSNDVPYGEKPKEIWNSNSGKSLNETLNNNNELHGLQSEQGLPGEQRAAGEEAGQASRPADGVRAERSSERNRPERTGSASTVTTTTEEFATKQTPKHNNKRNNVGERGKDYAPTTPKARFNANVEAIKLMRALIEDGVEAPTKDQMEALRQYSGWGGMGTFFNDENSAENKILRELLTDEEYQDAAMSINSAYYTPATVIDTLWDIAEAMGFKGGDVLEGSAGIGNIIGQMPRTISSRSNIEAVEIDSISGNILKLLYPDAKVDIKGFQDVVIPNGSVDLAITNVPFVTGLRVIDKVDKDLSRRFNNIHDFCIAKNIRKLREGGIGLFITSNGTLDKSTDLRAWITDEGQADVVGAFRLNNETFGGTTVTSDIIVVRKRTNGQKSPNAIDITAATAVRVGSYEDKFGNEHQTTMVINDYFREHPEMMAGEMAFAYEKGDTFRPGSYGLYPVNGMDQNKMLADFAKSMSKAKEVVTKPKEQKAEPNQLTAVKEGRMLVNDKGELCVSRRGFAYPLQLNDQKIKGKYTKVECFNDYQTVQKAVDDALQQQLNSPDDVALKPKLEALNKAYDTFVKKYGYLHKNTAIAFLRNDIDFPSFQALEIYSESKDIKGNTTIRTKKALIFSERVLGFKSEPKPQNIKDALISSIFRTNGIDLDWIADSLNNAGVKAPNGDAWTKDDVRTGIIVSKLGFEDPSTGMLEIRYKYLSGNVREKLAIAESYNTDGKYNTNVEELRKAVPMDIPSHLIDFSLGSSWIPVELYNDYLKENYDLEGAKVTKVEGMWVLDEGYRFRNEKNRSAGVYSEKFRETIYGHQLVAAALNNRPVRVSKQVKEGYGDSKTTKTIVDQAATQACAVRLDEIKEDFRQWIKQKMQGEPELAQRLEKIYNEKFNALVPMQIDDEFLPERFDGANVNIKLRPHQKRGAIRGLTSPTMLSHEVGTGKSFTLITTAMEMRRLGTAKKPMIVVQNATVAQMTSDAKLLYPNAKVLSLTEKDRNAEGRRAFYAAIRMNDWDIIIVPQSTFERIPDSPERELQFIQEKIDEKKHVIEAARAAGVDNRQLRTLEKELEKIEQEYGDKYLDSDPANDANAPKRKKKDAKKEAQALDKAETQAKDMLDRATDDVQFFDDLGVDALLVDEAHEYKHLGFQTSIGRGIKGIDPSYSKKCAGLYNKTRCVFEKAGWKNVVFATGTPISNTAAEIWTFMKYLMPADVMRQNDIYYFDDFVHNFGNISQMLEFSTSGKFKENTRFAAYVNRPELLRIWMQVADIVRSVDAKDVQDKLPKKEGGKDQDIFLPQSPSLINIMSAVRAELERYENMSGKEKKENSHIPLTMYGVAKRAAIDPRLVNPDAADEPLSKTNAAVAEIVKDLKATKSYKGTVAVFCDNQNRKDANGSIDFNIYDDIKEKLIKAGVPEKQIAIIKSGMSITAKQKVFDAVNSGDIRVVLGSTQTLGTGVNMQERLHLLIHMDAPDRPMDYTQRNGRIERQGNLHKEWGKTIRIVRFGVEDSLDVTAYQRLKTKSGFINSIMDGKSALANNQVDRTVEEEEEGLFDNPVAVLSGSQYALLKNKAERELRKYQGKKAQWEADQVYITNTLRYYKNANESDEQKIKQEERDLADINRMFPDGKVKTINVEGTDVDMTKADADVVLYKVIKEKINDPVNAIVKRNRENAIYDDETLTFNIKLDGHIVEFKVAVVRKSEWDGGKMRTVISKFTSYNSPDLHIKAEPSSTSVKDYLDDILDQVVTGIDYQDRIDAYKAAIERRNQESVQMREREGQPFQYDKELEDARKQVDEYTDLMKKELEEKEAKYANKQTGDVDLSKAEDSEDDDNLYRMSDEDEEPIFYSNAMRAVESIRQGKATPEQWLAMIQKNGGLKAGEDKWLGLSDWLAAKEPGKPVTKQEIIDYISENQIEVEDVFYAEEAEAVANAIERKIPGWKEAFKISYYPNVSDEYEIDIVNEEKAADLYNADPINDNQIELLPAEPFASRISTSDKMDINDWVWEVINSVPMPKDIKQIDSTRLKYQTLGLENHREIALVVPSIEPWNQSDHVHFGDAGEGRAVAWVRFGEALYPEDGGSKLNELRRIEAENDKWYKEHREFAKYGIGDESMKKESEERKARQRAAYEAYKVVPQKASVLVIDEIQSKRHQEGRAQGYSMSAAELRKNGWRLVKAGNTWTLYDPQGKAITRAINADSEKEAWQQVDNLKRVLGIQTGGKIPDAPFERNWHEMAMKRMLRYAAENGYDKIAWTTGNQQAQRYSIGKIVDQIGCTATFENGETRYDLYPKDNSGSISLFVKDGKVTQSSQENLVGHSLSDIVGKDIANKMQEMKPDENLTGEALRVGAEGMNGFYDEMLPRFVNKYAKKWGVSVRDIYIPALNGTGLTMHSIDVTPEMKQSVMQGQPMFREQDQFAEGQLFPIRTTSTQSSFNVLGQRNTYSTDLMPDEYTSEAALLDAVRMQFPQYYATIEDGSIKMQSWNTVMAEAKQAEAMKKAKTKGTESYVQRKTRQVIDAVNDMANRMHVDVEVLTTTDGLTPKQKRAKGWFNPKTHRIMIVLPNHVNQSDVINTLLHEGVAHYGLRQMFGPHFEVFLDNVYNNVDPRIKAIIDASMKKNGWNRHVATEEYLARLAERTNFETALNSGWWNKIKEFFLDMLAKVGFNTTLTDNELRYILWRSYDNLLHPDSRRSIFDNAQDIWMQSKLGVGQYSREYQPTGLAAESMVQEPVREASSDIDVEIRKRYNLKGGVMTYSVNNEADIAKLEGILDNKAIDMIRQDFKNPITTGSYLRYYHLAVLFTGKVKNGEELRLAWWHEQAHAITDDLDLESYGKDVLEWLKQRVPEYYQNTVSYPNDKWDREAIASFMEYMIKRYGEEKFLNVNFEGNEKIAIFATKLQNGYKYGREKENGDQSGRPTNGGRFENETIENQNLDNRVEAGKEIAEIISKALADGTYMLAPNGKLSNLNEHQWAQVRTKAFKEWFGDWQNDPENASKVVDENGEPKVMYHGTNLSLVNNGRPFWYFYDNSHFGTKEQAKVRAKDFSKEGNIKIYDVFLNIRNPQRRNDANQDYLDEKDMTMREYWELMVERAQGKGHDGIVYKNEYEGKTPEDSWIAFKPNQIKSATDNNGDFSADNADIRYSIRTKQAPTKTGTGYKVFVLKDGKLYPPMVANPNGEGTPIGMWLDADAAPIAGTTKTGRPQVKAGGKGTQGGSGQLAYRPGWHLGTIPYALQFNRKDANGEKTLFPNNFVWAEVEYADDVDYNDEAYRAGVNENGKYQHSLAGLKHVPTDGSYMYRTNPNPETDPWIITGAMKVKKILSREEVDKLVREAGREPQKMQDGDVLDQQTLDELNAEIKVNEEADDMGLLYRSMSDDAQDIYNEQVAKKSLRFAEAWQDSMIGLKALQDAIAAETGNVATGAEDAYRFENRMHGRAKNMTEQYDWRFYRPMLKAFSDFCKKHNMTQQLGIEYLVAKSGLERNVYYAFRNAMKKKVAEDLQTEREKLEKDYAKGKIAEATYKQMKADLQEKERTGVDDEMQRVRELMVYQNALKDYEDGKIGYTEYLRRIEKVIDANTGNNYQEAARDFSGLTETFAKDMYDAAQKVKKEAQRAIDPREKRDLWSEYDEIMKDAYLQARQVAEDMVFAAETDTEETNKLWNTINAATKETLKTSYESGLIDRKGYDKVREMFNFYMPLRGWEEDKAADVYTYMGKDNVFSPAVKKTWGRTSKAENPLAYIGNIAVSTILSGHRNQLKQHFLNYVMNNPTNLVSISESWYENVGTEENPIWILRSADTAGKSADEIAQIVNDFNEEMKQKQAAGRAMPVRGRLRLDVNATQGQKNEHVVEVQRSGRTYQLYINGDPKAAQALNGTNTKAVSRISDTYLGQQVTKLNRAMAMFFTSKNPAFVVSNLSRDLNMAGASVAINEGPEYNAKFIENAARVLTPRLAAGDVSREGIKAVVGKGKGVTGLMPKLMEKWMHGKLNEANETERYFKEFMDEGGETGFVNMLSVDSFKEKMQKEIREMNGSSLFGSNVKETTTGKALRLLGETFEFYNRCAEDATRFIVYMTSRQMGKSLEDSIADAKDVTLNFNRKGTGDKGNAEVRDLFIFVNPAIQALANMYRMAKGHPLKFGAVTTAFIAGGALIALANAWALNAFGDDDDKDAYWNLPPWVRKNNVVFWLPGTKNFVTIPLAQEFRVFYGIGEMLTSASLEHPVHNPWLEVFSSVADLVPINPTGNGGNLMVDLSPTMVQPLIQVGENIDFTGKPIWKDNQGNKYAPAYTKAYVSTPKYMIKIAEAMNSLTGGNEGKQGVVEQYAPVWGNYINNPAVWNHLLQGYFGGMYNTIAKGFDVITTAASGEMPKIYQTPVINRFLNRPVERDNAGALGDEYYKMVEDRDRLKHELSTWKKKAANGEEGAQEHVDEIMDSPEWKQVEVIDHYDKIMKDMRAGEKAATNATDKANIKGSIAMYKQQLNEELAAISDGKDPLEAAQEQFSKAKTFAERNKLRMRIERLMMQREGTEKDRTKSSDEDVAKALQYVEDDDAASNDVNSRYLKLATPENIRDDARIKAAKAEIKRHTDKFKQLVDDGKMDAANKYRAQHEKWFTASDIISSQSRAMNENKKLLGKGYDAQIMKLLDSNRRSILKAIDRLQ